MGMRNYESNVNKIFMSSYNDICMMTTDCYLTNKQNELVNAADLEKEINVIYSNINHTGN